MNKVIEHHNKAWIDSTWDKVEKKLLKVAVKSRDKIPYTTIDGVHDDKAEGNINAWTNGFWGGMMWLMYEATKNEEFKKTAECSEEKMDKALENFDKLHHDVGFMWHILSGANYRLTGNKKSRVRNLYAAATLSSRYNIDGEFIRAWPFNGTDGYSIIDCMMNIPLLYWASDELGDTRFKKVAMKHADMAMRDHIRSDGSANHIVDHNTEKPEVLEIKGGQGYSKDSCWSRGLAWAVYGFALSYIHTQKQDYLDVAKKTANYFIANASLTDYKTVVDFMGPKEPVYYDSTAGVCAACGLLEIAKYVSKQESQMYTEAAINLMKATDKHFCNYDDNEDALVLMGTERYPLESMKGVHIPIIYGDFFFVEALTKLKGREFLIW